MLTIDKLDHLTRRCTSFETFAALIGAAHYWPTLRTDLGRRYRVLADAYDATQTGRGDPRRAYRG